MFLYAPASAGISIRALAIKARAYLKPLSVAALEGFKIKSTHDDAKMRKKQQRQLNRRDLIELIYDLWALNNERKEILESKNASLAAKEQIIQHLTRYIKAQKPVKPKGKRTRPGEIPKWFVEGLVELTRDPNQSDREISQKIGISHGRMSQYELWRKARKDAMPLRAESPNKLEQMVGEDFKFATKQRTKHL